MTLVVYGIPTCGTCQKALAWLDHQGAIYDIINTNLYPPSRDTLEGWVQHLGVKPLLNTSGRVYRSLPATKQTWTEAQWIEALVADGMLLKRPLFVRDGEAVMVGFRPQQPDLRQRLGLEGDDG